MKLLNQASSADHEMKNEEESFDPKQTEEAHNLVAS